jgi:hypothetical protein
MNFCTEQLSPVPAFPAVPELPTTRPNSVDARGGYLVVNNRPARLSRCSQYCYRHRNAIQFILDEFTPICFRLRNILRP